MRENVFSGVTLFKLGSDRLTCEVLTSLSAGAQPEVSVSEEAVERLHQFRDLVDNVLEEERVVYGINTGFGFLSDVKIDHDRLEQLQINIIRSHACGVGPALDLSAVRALIISRSHSFMLGHSGVSEKCIQIMMDFLKYDILPYIPCKGSVGASGDLAPLAHLALGFVGEGQCYFQGELIPTSEALRQCNLASFVPRAKEGLSLINGTQVMTVLAAKAVVVARRLLEVANVAACLSLDAIKGTTTALDERIHAVRPHCGQKAVAASMRTYFEGQDQIMESHASCDKVQDPYSFRCAPQVHGATADSIDYVDAVIERELNSVTDNPLIFENGDFLSGGNFHGQPIALAADFLTIAVAELGSISECRMETMTNPSLSGLPAFIIDDSGLNSGFMIPHVVAASLVSENKILCHPACIDSIPTSADKEDHVSMGTIAARKSLEVATNVSRVLAIELIAACQGIDMHKPLQPAPKLQNIIERVRSVSAYATTDRSYHEEIEKLGTMIFEGTLL